MVKSLSKNKTGSREILGILVFTLGFLFFLSGLSYNPFDLPIFTNQSESHNWIGLFGAYSGFIMLFWTGIAGYIIPFCTMYIGFIIISKKDKKILPVFLWFLTALFSLSGLYGMQGSAQLWFGVAQSKEILSGGLIGQMLAERSLGLWIGNIGLGIILFILFTISIARMLDISIIDSIKKLWNWYKNKNSFDQKTNKKSLFRRKKDEQITAVDIESILDQQEHAPDEFLLDNSEEDSSSEIKPTVKAKKPKKKLSKTKEKASAKKDQSIDKSGSDSEVIRIVDHTDCIYKKPSLELLDSKVETSKGMTPSQTSDMGRVLTEALEEFGVEAKVTGVQQGPVVTCYEILPAAGVRVERIKALSDNIALKLHAKSIRIQAPIPGKGVCGVEVPNISRSGVFFRDLIDTKEFNSDQNALPLILGKDVSGKSMILDLAKMPHMLIAGATGAGKSVCMNTILTGLLMKYSPEHLRILLVDPKTVEFQTYNSLPHLVVPVITDAKKVAKGLNWVIGEMERRFKYFNQAGVRDIQGFNKRVIVKQEDLFSDEEIPQDTENNVPEHLPYIVIVIDELADLMAVAQAEIESRIARLAAKSRAAGIHMILATQRPDVKVITGTIKANFPARVAFKVSQKVDSRTILDRMGADALLGKGDMLVLPPGSDKLIRLQGAFTSDGEIDRVTDFWKQQGKPDFIKEIKEELESTTIDLPEVDGSGDDEMLEQALEVIKQTKRASTSSLQRRLRIGYTRAARIMDLLEEQGIIGPPEGAGPREILIDLDGEIPQHPGDENEASES